MYLGIEIGGTKLQLGLGTGNGSFVAFHRDTVELARGGDGIRDGILEAVPKLLRQAGIERSQVIRAGIGFGGPTDDATQTVITSHQVPGWADFPLAGWLQAALNIPCVLGNDADVAGLAEARLGAGRGYSPIFYMTIGSGIGGGLIIDGKMMRGIGRGAAEVGHLRILDERPGGDRRFHPLEHLASGWGIAHYATTVLRAHPTESTLLRPTDPTSGSIAKLSEPITAADVGRAANMGDPLAQMILAESTRCLAEAIRSVIVLLCPRRVVIGGGVSLIGERQFFDPLRRAIMAISFPPFAGLTEIVPACLGEEVVVHGAIELARGA